MNRNKVFASLIFGFTALGICSGAAAMQAVGQQPPSLSTNERHLSAELISLNAELIVTTAGSFLLESVTVDDRRSYQERTDGDAKNRAKVDLTFYGEQLRRVTIY